jgi:signal transduction histidine kinase
VHSNRPIVVEIVEAIASAVTVDDASRRAASLVRTVVDDPDCGVTISVPDRTGKLRAVEIPGPSGGDGRLRSARRREVFTTGVGKRLAVPKEAASVFALLPLACGGPPEGVLEVTTVRSLTIGASDALDLIAVQLGAAFRTLRERSELERVVTSLAGVAALAAHLIRSGTAEAATATTLRFVASRLRRPAAAWLAAGPGEAPAFLATRGMRPADARVLRSTFPTIPRWGRLAPSGRTMIESALADVLAHPVRVGDAGDGIIVVAGASPASDAAIDAACSLLSNALRRFSQAPSEREQLELGLAWTAHEVRQPLLGARATVQTLLFGADEDDDARRLLERTDRELGEAAGLVDDLLRWAVGGGPLNTRPRRVDRLLRQAISAAGREPADLERIVSSIEPELIISADGPHLRTAITNLIRNALEYSPRRSIVRVGARAEGGRLHVTVRNTGEPIPRDELRTIFDPFVRGASSSGTRGSGLGLFIARRVVEAHGGTIRVRSGVNGTTVAVVLPDVTVGRRTASAAS